MLPMGMLPTRCRVRPYLREGAGESLYGDWEERRCRLEPAPAWHTVRVECRGIIEEIPVKARMFLSGSAIPVLSEVEAGGVRMRALAVSTMWGMTQSHVEVELG